jgi:hypothetical protein
VDSFNILTAWGVGGMKVKSFEGSSHSPKFLTRVSAVTKAACISWDLTKSKIQSKRSSELPSERGSVVVSDGARNCRLGENKINSTPKSGRERDEEEREKGRERASKPSREPRSPDRVFNNISQLAYWHNHNRKEYYMILLRPTWINNEMISGSVHGSV